LKTEQCIGLSWNTVIVTSASLVLSSLQRMLRWVVHVLNTAS